MTKYLKYPRTFHLPWSQGATDDDKILRTVDHFQNKQVIVTEKLDGECTTLYSDHLHARSVDSKHHPSRNWIKCEHARVCHEIPKEWRICGENVFAKHSIHYQELETYFYVFGIYDERNFCLSWDQTLSYCDMLGLKTVPVLYSGVWDLDKIKSCWTTKSICGGEQEGYVVRLAEEFHYDNFADCVAKFVRKNHVQTSEHWLNESVVPNILKAK